MMVMPMFIMIMEIVMFGEPGLRPPAVKAKESAAPRRPVTALALV